MPQDDLYAFALGLCFGMIGTSAILTTFFFNVAL